MNLNNVTIQQLRQAADLKERIDVLQKKLVQLLGGTASETAPAAPKRKMSASAIARIRAAQKRRWAKVRAAQGTTVKAVKKTSGKMSAAAKSKLSARMKAIWAARKAKQ